MSEEKTYTPDEIKEFDRQAKLYFARLEADAKRAIMAVKTIHPQAQVTIIARVEGGHTVVVSEDEAPQVVAAVYAAYAKSKN